jgi:hypothetical protein
MLATVRALRTRLQKLGKDVAKLTGHQVSSATVRAETQSIVDAYFRNARPEFIVFGIRDDELSDLDLAMQAFLEGSHRKVTKPVYRSYTKSLVGALNELEQRALLHDHERLQSLGLDVTDQRIIATLTSMVPSAALSYEQASKDLLVEVRMSWRGPATDLREALRETLDHLAPDAEVTAQPGYKLEPDTKGPTMKQKVRYVLSKRGIGKAASASPEAAVTAVEELVGTFVRSIYTRSNVSTHTPTDKNEVLRVRDWVRVALCELLEIRT